MKNIFAQIPDQVPKEIFTALFTNPHVRIERIVSKGHTSQSDEWFDQDWDEWLILLQGRAILKYENSGQEVDMIPGSFILIPARTKHRVTFTQPEMPTIWLAVHIY